ncbi:hypothetical protein HDU92_005587, partial [Lobulomyces angularis]
PICKEAITTSPAIPQLLSNCGGLSLLTLGASPSVAIQGTFLNDFCSTTCKDAIFGLNNLSSICNDQVIFTPGETSDYFLRIFGGTSAAQISTNLNDISKTACLKNSTGGFCLKDEIKNIGTSNIVSGDNNNTSSLSVFGLMPPVAYAKNTTVVCTDCIRQQHQNLLATTGNLKAALEQVLNTVGETLKTCPPPGSETNTQGSNSPTANNANSSAFTNSFSFTLFAILFLSLFFVVL